MSTTQHFGADKMRKLILTIAMAASGLLAISSANAADLAVEGRGPRVATSHCGRHWHCWVGCPDGYSCSPLYGAYGPYGGTAYWGAYTAVGWGPRYYR
jgi:hypothetical protein